MNHDSFCAIFRIYFFSFAFPLNSSIRSSYVFRPRSKIPLILIRRLKSKCKCDRSEDGEDENEDQQQVKEASGDDEKKSEAADTF